MAAANSSKDTQNLIKSCSCFKMLDTYAVMERNLLKVIDLLQYEKKSLIMDYETKISNFEEKLMDEKLSVNSKLQSLSSEILQQKIRNHELKNSLKLVEENLKLTTLRSRVSLALRSTEISSTESKKICEINTLVNELHSKISLKFKQREFRDEDGYEIQNIFKSLRSEIKSMEKELHTYSYS